MTALDKAVAIIVLCLVGLTLGMGLLGILLARAEERKGGGGEDGKA